jgi:3-isopropylmalate/(R)-2-methylmalate dehydratase large subunit
MVLSTQCIMQPKPKKMRINVAGDLQFELHQKTLRFIISKLSTSGATGYFVE